MFLNKIRQYSNFLNNIQKEILASTGCDTDNQSNLNKNTDILLKHAHSIDREYSKLIVNKIKQKFRSLLGGYL